MPLQINVSIGNLEAIKRELRLFPQRMIPELKKATSKSALMVEREAKLLTPVDTGRLRSSIMSSLGLGPLAVGAKVATNVEYAIFVHEGTKRMRPRPFMKQAVDDSIVEIQKLFNMAIEASIRGITK